MIELTEEQKTKAFKAAKHDHKEAVSAKVQVDQLISEWNDMYYGKTNPASVKRVKSKLVMKEVAKQIELQKPNITEPFLSTSNPIRINKTGRPISGLVLERYLNTIFTSSFDRTDFVEKLADIVLREGTVWIRKGWVTKHKIVKETLIMSMQDILAHREQPTAIEKSDEFMDAFKVTFEKNELQKNEPTAKVCRNEFIFPDPGARTNGELQFLSEEKITNLSELRESNQFDEEILDELESKMSSQKDTDYSSALKSQRDTDALEYGYDPNFTSEDINRQRLSIIEYWGFYDLNEDGVAEAVRLVWAKKQNILLSIGKNPLPNQSIPYDNIVYSPRPFSLWGNALAYFIGDYQKAMTGMVRGIMDNMSLANNGQKFVRKGTIDYVNFKRMREGEKHIIVNKDVKDNIKDGAYNNLPPSLFSTFNMMQKASDDISGITNSDGALSVDNASKDDTSGMQMSMAQQRMSAMVRSVSNLIGRMCVDWLSMAEIFLSNEQIEALFHSEKEQVDFQLLKNAADIHISVKVGTDTSRMIKLQQLNMLMQQTKQLGKTVPPQILNELVAEMFELFDMYDKAAELRNYKPEPSEAEQAMQQMEMQKLQLENQKLQVEIQQIIGESQTDQLEGQAGLLDSQAGAAYKAAQIKEKEAKAEGHRVDSAIKPAEFIAEMRRMQNEQNAQDHEKRETI